LGVVVLKARDEDQRAPKMLRVEAYHMHESRVPVTLAVIVSLASPASRVKPVPDAQAGHITPTATTTMNTFHPGESSSHPFHEPAPLPASIPKVNEVGATSAPLKSAAFFIGAYCKEFNGWAIFSKGYFI
jgi:hypothetical protein